ncbi:unnamed protein product [Lota lota]
MNVKKDDDDKGNTECLTKQFTKKYPKHVTQTDIPPSEAPPSVSPLSARLKRPPPGSLRREMRTPENEACPRCPSPPAPGKQ